MIFQDGHSYRDVKGRFRVPVVFDNLIARGDMPVTIAVFINPGHDKSKGKPDSPWKSSNRSFEYDSLGDRYARFLLEEIIPEVKKKYSISDDPDMRASAEPARAASAHGPSRGNGRMRFARCCRRSAASRICEAVMYTRR